MALTMADAQAIFLGAFHAEDRVGYFTHCYSEASGDSDLQGLLGAIGEGTNDDEFILFQLRRIGDAVQELQAAIPTVKVSSHLETKDATGEVDVEMVPGP